MFKLGDVSEQRFCCECHKETNRVNREGYFECYTCAQVSHCPNQCCGGIYYRHGMELICKKCPAWDEECA